MPSFDELIPLVVVAAIALAAVAFAIGAWVF